MEADSGNQLQKQSGGDIWEEDMMVETGVTQHVLQKRNILFSYRNILLECHILSL